jgi:hypothetical protein
MPLPPISSDEWTYPPRDWVPVDYSGGDVDLEATLGFIPRAILADDEVVVVFRCADTPDGDGDRTWNLAAGQWRPGFFTHIIQSGTSGTIFIAK